jgi:CRP/FNR family transcriptional regulator, anaerobic regulatory protein
MDNSNIFKIFSCFTNKDLQNEIVKNSILFTAKKGDVIVREGQFIKMLPLVVRGSIRVFQQSEDGDREILLYYVQPGETCMMSLTACFFESKSPSKAIVDEKTEILYVPIKFIPIWQQNYSEWNAFTIKTFHKRYDELLDTFNTVVFKKIESRLLKYLTTNQKKTNSEILKFTHLGLANELGTTRVVISRILKMLEDKGKLKLLRGGIKLIK